MVTEQVVRPQRDLEWFKRESTPVSVAVLLVGGLALVVIVFGGLLVLAFEGFTPVVDLIRGYKSAEFQGVCVWAIVLGVAAGIGGAAVYPRMPTKVSREEALAGAVLGMQAAVLAAAAWYLVESNIDLLARSYFDFARLFTPEQTSAFIRALGNTLLLALTGEFFGIILGLMLAIFVVSRRAVVRAPARTYINFFRGTPLLWQIIFIGVAIPIGLDINVPSYRAMMIALSLNAGAYIAEVFRAGIQSVERGQLEAARGLGMSYLQAMRFAVLPQAIRRVIPPLLNEFVILIKDTSLILILGLTPLERELMAFGDYGTANTFNATYYVGTAVGYLVITLPLIGIVNYVERRLRSGLVGVGA